MCIHISIIFFMILPCWDRLDSIDDWPLHRYLRATGCLKVYIMLWQRLAGRFIIVIISFYQV